jgi:hypothetical protein
MDGEASEIPPRMKRVLQVVYAVEGVSAARVWEWPGRVAVAVHAAGIADGELLRRVERAVDPLRDAEETWDFGLLDDP